MRYRACLLSEVDAEQRCCAPACPAPVNRTLPFLRQLRRGSFRACPSNLQAEPKQQAVGAVLTVDMSWTYGGLFLLRLGGYRGCMQLLRPVQPTRSWQESLVVSSLVSAARSHGATELQQSPPTAPGWAQAPAK